VHRAHFERWLTMGSPYTGNPDNFPTAITIPDDSAPPTMAEINPALEALEDQCAYLFKHAFIFEAAVFNADGTFLVPAGAIFALLIGWGGGGGGGSGAEGGGVGDTNLTGTGGGGGGALPGIKIVPLTPGDSHAVTIGVGGDGGTAGSVLTPGGADGSDTTFGSLAAFAGGAGGSHGTTGEDYSGFVAGGSASRPPVATSITEVRAFAYAPSAAFSPDPYPSYATSIFAANPFPPGNGQGGMAALSTILTGSKSAPGGGSAIAPGGAAGTKGTASVDYLGGSGGGGGGGSGGAGGAGGNGGNGNNSSAATAGAAGASAAANSGGGGGGGGGGGTGLGGAGAGGNGGKGGSGKLWAIVARIQGAP
jgi:hypothetical protein